MFHVTFQVGNHTRPGLSTLGFQAPIHVKSLESHKAPIKQKQRLILTYCWWRKSGEHQLRLVVYPIIYRVLYIPGGAGFLPSTVSWLWRLGKNRAFVHWDQIHGDQWVGNLGGFFFLSQKDADGYDISQMLHGTRIVATTVFERWSNG